MLVNKSILQGALEVTKPDREFPLMDCVCVESDGTVVAINKTVLFVAQPVTAVMSERVPFGNKEPLTIPTVLLPSESTLRVVKAIESDKTFKGLLEHASLTSDPGSLSVKVETRDGQRTAVLSVKRVNTKFIDWRKLLLDADISSGEMAVGSFTFNRKRLSAAVKAVEGACRYDGNFSPIFCNFSLDRSKILLRSENELTGQRVLVLFSLAEITGGNTDFTPWERRTLSKTRLFRQK